MPKEWAGRPVYSVSEIVGILSSELEQAFPDVWVEGEVSGFKRAASGHCYFTLKDARASLKTVLFRAHALKVPFEPENGMLLLARGKLSVYEASGDLQLYATALEPAGLGALQMAFEQAKKRLMAEGLTDPARKRPIPPFPARLGVVTSLEGAALRDVLSVLQRRRARFDVVLSPALVQGGQAPESLRRALARLERVPGVEVILLTRGGGSMEDLKAFNDEALARAVAAHPIPVISAVGHEVDTVLTDLTADMRAPTPSVAAELLTAHGAEVQSRAAQAERRLSDLLRSRLLRSRERLASCQAERLGRLLLRRIERAEESSDRLSEQLRRGASGRLEGYSHRLLLCTRALSPEGIRCWVGTLSARLDSSRVRLTASGRGRLDREAGRLAAHFRLLHSLSPLGVLGRGYAAVFDGRGAVVTKSSAVLLGERISVALRQGALDCTVDSCEGSSVPSCLSPGARGSVDPAAPEAVESPTEEVSRGREEI